MRASAMHACRERPWKGGARRRRSLERTRKDSRVAKMMERRAARCGVGPSEAVLGATMYSGVLYALMIFAPNSKWTNAIVKKDMSLVPLGLTYGYFLAASWEPDTLSLLLPGNLADGFSGGFNPQFFPSLDGIATLFSRSVDSVASLMLHLQAMSIVVGRYIHLNALPARIVNSTLVLLSALCSPAAILLFLMCSFLHDRKEARFIKEGFN